MPIEKSLEVLEPEFRDLAKKWLHIVRDDLGIDARIVETLRSSARQEELARSGDSDVKLGWHQLGRAFDFLVFDGAGEIISTDRGGIYTRCGSVALALDCKWPIKIKAGIDLGHVEYHPGQTLDEYVEARKKGLIA